MHEEAVLRDLRRKLVEVAHSEGDVSVRRVRVWVGALAHLTGPTLRSRWGEVVHGTAADGATLEVEASGDPMHPDAQSIRIVDLTVDDRAASRPGQVQ